MTSLRCHEWDIHQSYRRDRNPPPWIKVHRNLMQNRKWARLTDAEKGQLVSIWMLAADRAGEVPNDAFLLRKICMLDAEPNIEKFIELGLLIPVGCQPDVNVTSLRRQSDAPEAEEISEAEEKERESSAPAKPRTATPKGSRIPDNWQPSPDLRTWAEGERPDLNLETVTASFVDYWTAKTGKDATKRDWDATFRNWVRKESASRKVAAISRAEAQARYKDQQFAEWEQRYGTQ